MDLEAVKELLRQAEQNKKHWQRKVAEAEAAIRYMRGVLAQAGQNKDLEVKEPAGPEVPRGRFSDKNSIEAAEIVLREAQQPLQLGEIVRRVRAGGYPKPRRNTRNTLNSNLRRRKDRFYKDPDAEATFGLRKWLEKEDQQEEQTQEAPEEEPPTPLVQE